MTTNNKHPSISWAQLKDSVSLIIGVQDAQDVKIDIEASTSSIPTSVLKLSLSNLSKQEQYACELTLFAPVEPALSLQEIKPRGVFLTLAKKKSNDVWFWPRLTLDKVKNSNISIDWNNWKDEDDLEHTVGGGGGTGNNGIDVMAGLGGGVGGGTGGLSLESEEIQNTLAALREEQMNLKKEELLSGKGTSKERRQMIDELERDQLEKALMKQVPKFGSAATTSESTKQEGNDDDDDEDDLPPLV